MRFFFMSPAPVPYISFSPFHHLQPTSERRCHPQWEKSLHAQVWYYTMITHYSLRFDPFWDHNPPPSEQPFHRWHMLFVVDWTTFGWFCELNCLFPLGWGCDVTRAVGFSLIIPHNLPTTRHSEPVDHRGGSVGITLGSGKVCRPAWRIDRNSGYVGHPAAFGGWWLRLMG